MALRFFPVDNYLIFYLPNESKKVVIIYRIIYGGRDIKKLLEQTDDWCPGVADGGK